MAVNSAVFLKTLWDIFVHPIAIIIAQTLKELIILQFMIECVELKWK